MYHVLQDLVILMHLLPQPLAFPVRTLSASLSPADPSMSLAFDRTHTPASKLQHCYYIPFIVPNPGSWLHPLFSHQVGGSSPVVCQCEVSPIISPGFVAVEQVPPGVQRLREELYRLALGASMQILNGATMDTGTQLTLPDQLGEHWQRCSAMGLRHPPAYTIHPEGDESDLPQQVMLPVTDYAIGPRAGLFQSVGRDRGKSSIASWAPWRWDGTPDTVLSYIKASPLQFDMFAVYILWATWRYGMY
jgi:hypothetical protein